MELQKEAKPSKNKRYPWGQLEVGGCISFEFTSKRTDNVKAAKTAINAAYAYGERHGHKYTIKRFRFKHGGVIMVTLRIWRIEPEVPDISTNSGGG